MSTTAIQATTTAYTANSASSDQLASSSQTSSDLKSEFLELLLTQLKNQDPTNPVDSTQMVAQQAQLAELEQQENVNSNLVTLMVMQNNQQATSLLGKTVTGTDGNGTAVSGTVTGISFDGSGSLSLTVGDSSLSLSQISDIGI